MKHILALLFATLASFAIPQLINYQGQLTSPSGIPLDTTVAMTFALYDTSSGGTVVWTETHPAVVVSDGRFSVQLGSLITLPDVFAVNRWLGVTVGGDTELSPREQLISVAYSYRVGTVDSASGGTINGNIAADSVITGGVRFGDGSVQTSAVTGIGAFQLDADTNSFDATRSWVKSMGYLKGTNNEVSATGFVGGGDYNKALGAYSFIGGGGGPTPTDSNCALGIYSAITGGSDNIATGNYSVIVGGNRNTATFQYSAVGGGHDNEATNNYSTVGGGYNNGATAEYSTISGGCWNRAEGSQSTVGGGNGNNADGEGSTVGGGVYNDAQAVYSTVSGGSSNNANGLSATIGGGSLNLAADSGSTVAGGKFNFARGDYSFIGGGGGWFEVDSNSAVGRYSVIVGGKRNSSTGGSASVGGGSDNVAEGPNSVIGGGRNNWAIGDESAICGGSFNYAPGDHGFVGGGVSNHSRSFYAAVSGGIYNRASGPYSFIGGGGGTFPADSNSASGENSVITGGSRNEAAGSHSAVGGGTTNEATGYSSTISGGYHNLAADSLATVSGGGYNRARGKYSFIGGGGGPTWADSNSSRGAWSVIPGGSRNETAGNFAFSAGHRAKALHDGTFVWADSSASNFFSTAPDQFLIRATGGVGIGLNNPAERLEVNGDVKADTIRVDAAVRFPDGSVQTTAQSLATYQQDSDTSTWDATRTWVTANSQQDTDTSTWDATRTWVTANSQQDADTSTWDATRTWVRSNGYMTGSNNIVLSNGFVGGGDGNYSRFQSVVGGGYFNKARGAYSVVIGGGSTTEADSNSATGSYSVILGGNDNRATDSYSVCGGNNITNNGSYSFAFGRDLTMNTDRGFAFSDGSEVFSPGVDNTANFLVTGGFRIWTGIPVSSNIGAQLPAGSGTWTGLSDSTTKRNRRNVDTGEILRKVTELPIQQWSYKSQDPSIEHVGPMAQDFWNSFHLGDDSLSISTIDPSGVALAAIQELAKQNAALQADLLRQSAEVAELKQVVRQLTQLGLK